MSASNELQRISFSPDKNILNKSQLKKKTEKIIDDINSALSEDNYALADKHIKTLKKLNPDPVYIIKQAHLMYIRKNYQKAEKLYKKVLERSGKDHEAEIYLGLGQVYYESKMHYDSFLAFSIVVSNHPSFKYSDFIYLKLLKLMVFYQKYPVADEIIRELLTRRSPNQSILAETLFYAALIKFRYRKIDLALEICKKSLKICASYKSNLLFLITLAHKDPEAGEKKCLAILNTAENPEEWVSYCFIRAVIYVRLEKFSKAVQILEEDCKNFKFELEYLNYLGQAYYGAGEKVKALEVFQRIREKFPENCINLNNLAFVYTKLGMKFEAFYVCNVLEGLRNGKKERLEDLRIQEEYINPLNLIEII